VVVLAAVRREIVLNKILITVSPPSKENRGRRHKMALPAWIIHLLFFTAFAAVAGLIVL
jgi:hypothetical protein